MVTKNSAAFIHDSCMNWKEQGTGTLGSKVGVANTLAWPHYLWRGVTALLLSLSMLNNH